MVMIDGRSVDRTVESTEEESILVARLLPLIAQDLGHSGLITNLLFQPHHQHYATACQNKLPVFGPFVLGRNKRTGSCLSDV